MCDNNNQMSEIISLNLNLYIDKSKIIFKITNTIFFYFTYMIFAIILLIFDL